MGSDDPWLSGLVGRALDDLAAARIDVTTALRLVASLAWCEGRLDAERHLGGAELVVVEPATPRMPLDDQRDDRAAQAPVTHRLAGRASPVAIEAYTPARSVTTRPPAPAVGETPLFQTDTTYRGAVVVRVAGELDLDTAPVLDARLHAAHAVVDPPAPVVLDLAELRYLDAATLAVLVTHHHKCEQRGSSLRIVAAGRAVLQVLQASGTDTILAPVPTMDQALPIHDRRSATLSSSHVSVRSTIPPGAAQREPDHHVGGDGGGAP